jgi:ethanolamine utilization protein EutA
MATRRNDPIVSRLEQTPFRLPADMPKPIVTFSGGVGELVYRHLQGEPWPTTTHFGDLGIDLAQRIVASPCWKSSLDRFRPQSGGRATVFGLLQHTTDVSGSTLFLPAPEILPLADVPILGRLQGDDSDDRFREVLTLARCSSRGGGIQVQLGCTHASAVADLGKRLARILDELSFPPAQPLVVLLQENVGKLLGQYVTRWGGLPLRLIVIDEVPLRNAQFVHIGMPRHQLVPVSFFGLGPDGGET